MTIRVLGAGMGRTGTLSLRVALEKLLGGRCYHMLEVFARPEHIEPWHDAARGRVPDWDRLFDGYNAAVDEPPAAFWRELSAAYPDALVVLSVRDPASWWDSCNETVFPIMRNDPPPEPAFMRRWHAMMREMMNAKFPGVLGDRDAALEAYERHNAEVRRTIPAGRLLEWRVEQGWAPLCAALDVPVPDEHFPHVNTRAEFLARLSAVKP